MTVYNQPEEQPQQPAPFQYGPTEVEISTTACISEAWEILKSNAANIIIASLIISLAQGFAGQIPCVGPIAALIVQGPLYLGLAMFMLKAVRKQNPDIGEIFNGFKNFKEALVACLLMVLFTLLGFIALIVPGIILTLRYSMTYYIMTDQNLSGWESMKASNELVKGYTAQVFVLFLLIGLLQIAGALACCIGLFVTTPLGACAIAIYYNKLTAIKYSQQYYQQ